MCVIIVIGFTSLVTFSLAIRLRFFGTHRIRALTILSTRITPFAKKQSHTILTEVGLLILSNKTKQVQKVVQLVTTFSVIQTEMREKSVT